MMQLWFLRWQVSLFYTLFLFHLYEAQQIYLNNKQFNCYNNINYTKGFSCNGVSPSCKSYLTFRSNPPYNTPSNIAYLLSSDTNLIAAANNISAVDIIPTNTQLIVPVNCSCSGLYYQHNASYILKYSSETYFIVSNNTYQGLTTCQAMMDQNPYGDRNLTVGLNLHVPLLCACPTSNQSSKGVKYLLNYMVTWNEDISSIAKLFGVDRQSILDANDLTNSSIIYPFNPVLVPLSNEPKRIEPITSPSPPPSPNSPPPRVSSKNSKKSVFIGVGIGAAVLLLLLLSLIFFFFCRSRKEKNLPVSATAANPILTESSDYSIPESKPWSISSEGVRSTIDSLIIYNLEDLQKATNFFSDGNRIKGTVYKGSFRGDAAAVKVMEGDVSREIDILMKINHTNIVRLSGFCFHGGNSYLVYEYADNGSLRDQLDNSKKFRNTNRVLSWKQRVQVAYDVADALNYLHNYANPPYMHKNLKSSNILLDGSFRAKITNFGLARMVVIDEKEEQDGEEKGFQLTRHVVGTYGYMAPEYIENGVITPNLDVFAFGVVILEIISGKEAAVGENNRGEELLSVAISHVLEGENVREKLRAFMDSSLRDEYPLELAFSMAQLACTCVARDLNSRPSVSNALVTLSKILSSSLNWDPTEELERSRSIPTHSR